MSELPKGWKQVKLSEVSQRITKGSTPTSYGYKYQDKGIAFVKIENVKNGLIDTLSIKHFIAEEANLNQRRSILEAGDILFSIAGTIGTTCLVRREDLPANTNQALAIIRGTSDVFHPGFLRYQLESEIAREQSKQLKRGGGMNNISLADVGNLDVVVPPPNEQRRIVAKLEKLLSRVDAAQARLATIPRILKRFRHSVLAAACSGRLTADWRDENLELSSNQSSRKDDLPESWVLGFVEHVAIIGSGQSSKEIISKCGRSGEIPWFKVSDMNLEGNEKFMRRGENYLAKRDTATFGMKLFPAGTIIFPKRGGAISTNKKRILTQPSCIDCNTMALTPRGCSPDYFWVWFGTIDLGGLSDGSNVPQINNPDILPLEIPLPPLAEQQEIVRRVEALFTTVDALEARYVKAKAHVDKLTQSILAKAFRGELVPQDPNDEPACVLLDRIKTSASVKKKTPKPSSRN